MKKFLMLAASTLLLFSCQNEDVADSSFNLQSAGADYSGYPATVQTVSGNINSNTTWTSDKVWEISGVVRVRNGATLTIEPGTFIKAKPLGEGIATGVLVITKNGKINAQGTAQNPIVFTSYNLLDGSAGTTATSGDFGGVVLLGDAEVNNGLSTNVVEGLGDQNPLSDFYFGGSNNSHDAGDMSYVRIEFAGRILSDGVEINGLTFGGVGNGTNINHIQVSYGKDDSYEFFGGTVSPTHLVSFAADDDNFDFDLGYTGSLTKAIAIADKYSTHSQSGGNPDSNGIELDNNANGSSTTIITRPVISDLSIIGVSAATDGGLYENAIHVRRRGEIDLTNVTVTGYNTGIKWDSPSVSSNSVWSNFSAHGFVTPATSSLGFGNPTSTSNPAQAWGLTQPFFNNSGFNLSGNTGAFATESGWANGWTKFSGF